MIRETLKRIFKTGWTNFKRNSYVTFATTGVMVLVLLLFLSLISANYLASNVVGGLEEKVDISVYFKTTASEADVKTVQADIQKLPAVKNVEYISREQALETFKARHVGDPLIQDSLAELEDNPLQASLNIKAHQTSQYQTIVDSLEAHPLRTLMDKINFYENEQVIQRVEKISGGIQNWGLLASIFLAVIAVLVTFNTIRLTIYNQKQEIEIMRLVGGSNWHIRGPYLVEGSLYGIFAAIVALAIFYPFASFVSPKVAMIIPGVNFFGYFLHYMPVIIIFVLVAGMFLGMVSSLIAIRRFLKI